MNDVAELSTPDRLVVGHPGICEGTLEDDFGNTIPCPFDGVADVAIFDDTEEAIWYCDRGHENYERWERFA